MVMSGQGIRLFGIIESLWLMAASCWPSHVAKSASQTSVASSINGRFFRTSISQDVLNLTILLKQISITLSRAITITGRVLTSEYLICATSGGGQVEERFDRCGLPGRSNVKWRITMGLRLQESLDTAETYLYVNPVISSATLCLSSRSVATFST